MLRFKDSFLVLFIVLALSACTKPQHATKVLFNSDWQFTISDATFDEIKNNSQWDTINLPHTPVIESKVMKGQWQGVCWYKKDFMVPNSAKTQRLFLRFEGAMNASEFWVNGTKIASHLGGYLPVVFDFTDAARFGEHNILYVKLDNTDNAITGPKPMNRLDFSMYGGLYRDVFLITKHQVYITDPILANKTASGGVFVTYPSVSDDEATVAIQTHIQNSGETSVSVHVLNELWMNDVLVASSESEGKSVEAGSDSEIKDQLTVQHPSLWSPQSPTLYTLKTKLISDGTACDLEETSLGIRSINFTNNAFYINGEKQRLRGVNRHQDYPYIGYALSNEANYRDALRIKEAGFDYVRLSHYPHSPAFMEACDELGLVVMDAILGWQYYSTDSLFQQQIFRTAHDLIRRDRNHPCVIAWEVSLNESWMDEPFIDTLHNIAHAEYPGNQCFSAGWQVYGYDIFLQARQHRLEHYSSPTKPYSVSEYGDWEYYAMNAGLNQDAWNGLMQSDRSSRQLLMDGETRLLQQVTNIQEAHNDNLRIPAFADSYWVMFDYNRGYAGDLEASGISSIDRLPKFSYYFFQSQRDAGEQSELFNAGPMVYIASYWQKDSPLNVKVFSNADEVELFLNGTSLGRQTPDVNEMSDHLAHPPFTFTIDLFEPGELKAKAYIAEKEVAKHAILTPEKPVSITLRVDEDSYAPKPRREDVVFVYAELKDEHGTIVPLHGFEMHFEIVGQARILNPEIISTEAGIATALLKIEADKDETITINVRAKGFSDVSMRIIL